VQGPANRDSAALRSDLVAALMELPFINALPDRRMLLTLVRQDVVRFPDVQERSEARLHVTEIVLTCLQHPGGLRALSAALETMAPYADGTLRVRQFVESYTTPDPPPDGEDGPQRPGRRDPGAFLSQLVAALMELPFINAQPCGSVSAGQWRISTINDKPWTVPVGNKGSWVRIPPSRQREGFRRSPASGNPLFIARHECLV
jgi:hypothetical protein